MMKKRSLKIDRLRFDSFYIVDRLARYTGVFSDCLNLFHSRHTDLFLALFLVIFHQSLHSQAAESFFRELLVMGYGIGQGIQDKIAFCSRIIRQLQIFNKKVDEESRILITFNDPWTVSL